MGTRHNLPSRIQLRTKANVENTFLFKTRGQNIQNIVVAETKWGLKTRLAFQINQLNYGPPHKRSCQVTRPPEGNHWNQGQPPSSTAAHTDITSEFRKKKPFYPYLLHFSPLFSQDKAIINSFPFYLYPLVIAKVPALDLWFNIMSMSWGNIIHAVSWNLKEKISILVVTLARVVISWQKWWRGEQRGGCSLHLQAPANV